MFGPPGQTVPVPHKIQLITVIPAMLCSCVRFPRLRTLLSCCCYMSFTCRVSPLMRRLISDLSSPQSQSQVRVLHTCWGHCQSVLPTAYREFTRRWKLHQTYLSLQAFIHHCRRIWIQATATAPIYQAVQKVWLSPQDQPLREKCKKLAPKFIGPFAIQEVINPAKVRLVNPVHESAFDIFKVKPVCESSGSSKGVLPIASAASFVLVSVGGVFSTCSIRRGMVQKRSPGFLHILDSQLIKEVFQHHADQQSKPSTFTRGTTLATLPSPSPITNHKEDNMNLPTP